MTTWGAVLAAAPAAFLGLGGLARLPAAAPALGPLEARVEAPSQDEAQAFGDPRAFALAERMDAAESARWYRAAAAEGSALGQAGTGDLAQEAKDYETAARWFRKAAEQGSPYARWKLGILQYWGEGLPSDSQAAFALFLESARQGYPPAQRVVGCLYMHGQIVKRDRVKGLYWTRRAALHGDRHAQANLAWAYEHGSGVRKDPSKAAYWRRLSQARP